MAQILTDVLIDGAVLAKKRMCDVLSDQAAQFGCAERQKYGKCAVPSSAPIEQLPGQVRELYKHASQFPYLCGYRVHRTYDQACNLDPSKRKVYGIPLCLQDRQPQPQPQQQQPQPQQQQPQQQQPQQQQPPRQQANTRRKHRHSSPQRQRAQPVQAGGGSRRHRRRRTQRRKGGRRLRRITKNVITPDGTSNA